MTGIYIATGNAPFGDQGYMPYDMYAQYVTFFSELQQKLRTGGSLLYSWHDGLGINFTAIYAYYLSSPFNWLIMMFPHDRIIDVMDALIALRMGLAGLTAAYYLEKHFRSKHLLVAAFAVFYAMSSYIAAFRWNIMWLDCIVLMPLIMLGLERLVRENRGVLYGAALGLSIFSNYYISIMICFFCVFYFIVLMSIDSGEKEKHFFWKRLLSFAIYSALAGGFAAVLILPELFALQLGAAGKISFPTAVKTYFSFFDLLSRTMAAADPAVLDGKFPNMYCSVAVLILLPLYWASGSVKLREKIGKTVLMAFFLVCYNVNVADFVWHGFHYPNCLPCRQSFIYVLLVLTMSMEGLRSLKKRSVLDLCLAFAAVLALLSVYAAFLTKVKLSTLTVVLTGAFLAAYFVLMLISRKPRPERLRRVLVWVLLAAAVGEATANLCLTGVYTTSKTNYISDNAAIAELLGGAAETDTTFYRVENEDRRTCDDGSWNYYNGVSLFSSVANAGVTAYLGAMGMEHTTNKYAFTGYTPLAASILGVKYFLTKQVREDDYTSLVSQTDGEYLYVNNCALPLGFMVASDLEQQWETDSGNPFAVQNSLTQAVAGLDVFANRTVTRIGNSAVLEITDSDATYLYLRQDSKIKSVTAAVTAPNGNTSLKSFTNIKRSYLLNLGSLEPGSTVTVTVNNGQYSNYSLSAAAFSGDVFKEVTDTLNEQPYTVESYNDTSVTGAVTAASNGLLYTSIPWDKGWSVTVDGVRAETQIFKGALIAVPLAAGTHTVVFTYQPQGLKPGIAISVCSLLLFLLLALRSRVRRGRALHGAVKAAVLEEEFFLLPDVPSEETEQPKSEGGETDVSGIFPGDN